LANSAYGGGHQAGENWYGSFMKGELSGDAINSAPEQFVNSWLSTASGQVAGEAGMFMNKLSGSTLSPEEKVGALQEFSQSTPDQQLALAQSLPMPEPMFPTGQATYQGLYDAVVSGGLDFGQLALDMTPGDLDLLMRSSLFKR
jgi:hypothetical protein